MPEHAACQGRSAVVWAVARLERQLDPFGSRWPKFKVSVQELPLLATIDRSVGPANENREVPDPGRARMLGAHWKSGDEFQ